MPLKELLRAFGRNGDRSNEGGYPSCGAGGGKHRYDGPYNDLD
nr:hypothetical protein [Nocardia carnea]